MGGRDDSSARGRTVAVGEDARLRIDLWGPLLLRGRVVRAPSGEPAVDVLVRASARDASLSSSTRTDGAGSFELPVPRGLIDLGLVATAEPDRPDAGLAMVAVERDEGRWQLAPVLIRVWPGLALEGRARDIAGRPVAGARVAVEVRGPLDHVETLRATCDPAGRFRVTNIARGTGLLRRGPRCAGVRVRVEAPGFTPFQDEVTVVRGSAPLEVVLARPLTVAGRVRDAEGRGVVAEVLVRDHLRDVLYGRDADGCVSDADGSFRLSAAPERGFLRVSAPGFVTRVAEVRLPLEDLEVRLERGSAIEGLVLGADGQPARMHFLEACAVPASPRWSVEWSFTLEAPGIRPVSDDALPLRYLRGETDAEGRFRLADVPDGRSVSVRSGGIELGATGGSREVRLALPAPEPGRSTSASLRVVGEGGAAFAHDDLCIEAWIDGQYEVVTHVTLEDGRTHAWIPGLRSTRVVVSAPGHGAVARVVDLERVARDARLDLGTLVLSRGGDLAVRVRWPDAPLLGLRASWTDPSGAPRYAFLEAPGSEDEPWPLGGSAPGEVSVKASLIMEDGSLRDLPPVRGVVRAGETTTLDLDLR